MKTLKQNELYQNLSEFLRNRGIDFKEGAYTQSIRRGCALLTDTINTAQRGLHQAKARVESTVEEVRQAIHHKTAPPPTRRAGARRTAKPAATATAGNAGRTSARAAGTAKVRSPKPTSRPTKPQA